jgi:hypothetical protein
MPGDRYHEYPLSSASRRRRQLVLRGERIAPREPAAAADDPFAPDLPAPDAGLPPAPGEFDDQTAGDDRIARIIAARDPRAWLLIGESFLQPSPAARDWSGWIDRFTALLRGPLCRRRDTVIDACCADSTLSDLRARVPTLVAAASADVAFLVCGPADARCGVAGLARFESHLNAVVGRLVASGAVVVISTSPVPWCGPDDAGDISHDVYAEAVRACAVERGLLLVDHRRTWEAEANRPGGTSTWSDGASDRVGAPGHAALARFLFEALWRRRPERL